MATVAPIDSIGKLQSQVTQSLDAFRSQNNEGDRVAALTAAQKLVQALQKPQDSLYHLAYSVSCLCKTMVLVLTGFSPLKPCVCELGSTWASLQL